MDNKPNNQDMNKSTSDDGIDEVLKIVNRGRPSSGTGSSENKSGGIQADVSFSAIPINKAPKDDTKVKAEDSVKPASQPEKKKAEEAVTSESQKEDIKIMEDKPAVNLPFEVVAVKKSPEEVKKPPKNDATIQDFDAVKKKKEAETPKPPADATKVDFDSVKVGSAAKKAESKVIASGSKADNKKKTAPEKKKPEDTESFSGVSLDDFNEETESKKRRKKDNDDIQVTFLGSVKFGIIKLVAYIAFVLLSCYLISSTIIKVGNDVFAFVKDDTEIIITVPEGATTKDIAKILDEAGVIDHPFVFEKYAEFRISKRSYLTGKYLVGDITVNPMMNFDTLINTLSDYERSVQGTVRVTIPEGLTVDEILELLEKKGVSKKADFIEALQSFDYEYKFMEGLKEGLISEHRFNTDMSYRLEGYLFPDTYDFYINENPVSAIDKLLTNFNRKFEEEFYARCAELNMTVDELMTVASLVEKEGNNAEDYYYISSVFHNRLKNSANHPFLNSDATIQYALHERAGLYNIDTSMNHPYNTYNNKGLPPGPICNPGIEAIYAALYPEKTSYYYFYTKKNGETVFSKTYEQHQRYVNADKSSN